MTDPFADVDSARARIQSQLDEARARDAAITVLAEQVTAASATVRSPNGEVTVTATAAAVISDVTVSEAGRELAGSALGRLITETIARAQRAAAEQALAAAEQSLGSDSSFVAGLRADVDSRFGPPTGLIS